MAEDTGIESSGEELEGAEGANEREEAFAQKLNQQQAQITKTQALAELLADPDLAAVYSAKQRGQRIKVVPDNGADPSQPQRLQQPEPEVEPNWEELDNKQLVQHMGKQLIRAQKELTMQAMQPVLQKLQQFDQYVQKQEANSVGSEITQLRSQYKDFDLYAPAMMKLTDQHPTLGPKQLYALAKAEQGEIPDPRQRQLETERPTHTSARPQAKRKAPLPQGRAGIRQALAEAAKRVDYNAIMNGGDEEVEE
jgi:hypothetical protein